MDKDKNYDQVLANICLTSVQWRMGADGYPNQLRWSDLKPVTREWLEFIQRSIIPTSNCSECTTGRAVMIYCIMIGHEVDVSEVIPQQIYHIASNDNIYAKLSFPHLIYWVCEAAEVRLDNDFPIPIERLISRKTMEHAREYTRVSRGGQAEEEAQQAHLPSLVPQEHYFPPQEYCQQLTSSVE
ncbi:hypothetical protein AHAS_Ahas15G0191700 [Arachis hypogaea]